MAALEHEGGEDSHLGGENDFDDKARREAAREQPDGVLTDEYFIGGWSRCTC
jgi:hypothetical protein